MPIYEYECKKCGHRFEKIQKFSDAPETKCPKCRGKLEQLLSAPAVQFKGSGWYVTDYGKGSRGPSSKSDGGGGDSGKSEGSSEKSESKSESKSDSKSESKTDTKSHKKK